MMRITSIFKKCLKINNIIVRGLTTDQQLNKIMGLTKIPFNFTDNILQIIGTDFDKYNKQKKLCESVLNNDTNLNYIYSVPKPGFISILRTNNNSILNNSKTNVIDKRFAKLYGNNFNTLAIVDLINLKTIDCIDTYNYWGKPCVLKVNQPYISDYMMPYNINLQHSIINSMLSSFFSNTYIIYYNNIFEYKIAFSHSGLLKHIILFNTKTKDIFMNKYYDNGIIFESHVSKQFICHIDPTVQFNIKYKTKYDNIGRVLGCCIEYIDKNGNIYELKYVDENGFEYTLEPHINKTNL